MLNCSALLPVLAIILSQLEYEKEKNIINVVLIESPEFYQFFSAFDYNY